MIGSELVVGDFEEGLRKWNFAPGLDVVKRWK